LDNGEDLEVELLLQLPPNLSIGQVIDEFSGLKGLRSINRLN